MTFTLLDADAVNVAVDVDVDDVGVHDDDDESVLLWMDALWEAMGAKASMETHNDASIALLMTTFMTNS